MLANRQSRRLGIVYALLIALSLLLIAASNTSLVGELRRGVSFALSPIQDALGGATRSATSIFSTIAEIDRLRGENADLAARVQRLEVENRQLEAVRAQNTQLTELLDLRSSVDFETVAVQVISRHLTESERLVVIDKGESAGIAVGDAVLASGGALAGQVIRVGPSSSEVLLITDTRFIVIGLVETSRATGEIRGQLGDTVSMTKIPSTDAISVGERVVTAGIDLGEGVRSPFPRGLLIGQVVDVDAVPNDIVQTAQLVPTADLNKLEYLLVVTDYEAPGPLDPGASPEAGASRAPSTARPSGSPDAGETSQPEPTGIIQPP